MKKLLALLLAIAMLATLCACGKKDKGGDEKGVSNDPEAVAQAFAEAYMLEDYESEFDLYAYDSEAELKDNTLNDYDSEEEFFEELSEEYDEDIDSWKDAYKAVLNDYKEYLKDEYGDDYKIKTKVIDTEELDEDDVEEIVDYLLDEYEDYIDEDAVKDIEEAMNVDVEISISGEDGDDAYLMIITVVKIDGKWKVADYDWDDDYGDDYEDDDYEEEYYDEYYDEY